MKLMHFVAAGALAVAAACSEKPADEAPSAPPAERAAAPAAPAAPVATAGEAPAPAAPRPKPVPIEVRDARAAATGPTTQAAREAGVNTDAAVQQDFRKRLDTYVTLRKSTAKGDARLKQSDDPAAINEAQRELAARIIAARPDAKQGDIFTPEIRDRFRRLLAPELKGEDGRDTRAVLKDDAPPAGSIPFKVNARYPEGLPKPTVPANLLLNLPTLPAPLEYRVIGRHLLLLDTDADVIVDYIPNAIP